MRVTHSARRTVLAGALALALAACGKDNGPSEFSPQGTSADMASAQDAFASEASASFAAAGVSISGTLHGSPMVVSAAQFALGKPAAAGAKFARQLAALAPHTGGGIQASAGAIPADALGVTYVWDDSAGGYVASSLTGAPSNGTRFMLYAIDPLTLHPVLPAVEVGYAEIVDQSTASATSIRVKVVGGPVVYLDYTVTATSTTSGGLVTIGGSASNGSVTANFTLKNTITQTAGNLVLALDYHLGVPARKLSLVWAATFANLSDTEVAVTLHFTVSGPNGDVDMVGTYGATGGTFTVKVNGSAFATVTLQGSAPVVTGANGQPLTSDEELTLQKILDYYDGSLTVFGA